MRSTTLVILAVGITASIADAGVVEFDPGVAVVDPLGDTTATFNVSIYSDLGVLDGLEMVIGSHELHIVEFEYAPGFPPWVCDFAPCDGPIGIYPSDFLVSAYPLGGATTPFHVGTVLVDAAGLPPGDYEVMVDSAFDGMSGIRGPGGVEPLIGFAIVHVIPEPGTLVFFGLSVAWCLRRRHVAP